MIKRRVNKICFIVYDYNSYGGVEAVAVNLANLFSKEAIVYYLGIVGDTNSTPEGLNKHIKQSFLLQKEYRSKRLRNLLLHTFNPLRAFLIKENIDLLVILGHYPAFLAAATKVFLGIPYVFCDHGALANQWGDKKTTLMRYIAAKVCDRIVVLTEKTRNDYIERFKVKPNKIHYIYNWIEPLQCDSKKYNTSSSKIISVGRLSPEKGFDQLIESMRTVVDNHPKWQLDIYGDGEERIKLNNLIEKYNLQNNIHLMGKCNNVREKYKDYAVYVLPSYREGLPITLLEAKINMLPIVSFDVDTGPREIVRDGVDGFLVEKRNTAALASAICRLIEKKEERISFSNNAKGNLSLFDKTNIAPLWRELFVEMVQ